MALHVEWTTGLLTAFFRTGSPRSFADVAECDFGAFGAFCRGMLDRGIYLPPSQYEAWFPSLAHGEAEIEATIAAARSTLATL